ncbi:MAG: hypothetical protein GX608_10255 [Lentisphaerae bacterium]|nr:hypothetical protein [Lentisphaerota bacterium]
MAQTSDGTFVNWHAPTYARDYADPDEDVEVGQLEDTPDDLVKGVRVSLPDTVRSITNPVGAGKAAYSGTGMNEADIVLQRSLDIGPDAAGVFSFDFWCDIEEDWDYGYFMVNGTNIPDATLFLTNGNPNGNNLGWGLTGKKNGTMAFDLSAYKGQTVTLAFRYVTDAYVTGAGWFLNNLVLDGVTNETFETAEAPSTFPDGWTNSSPGWGIAPQAIAYPNYYLVEWRADSKYDRMLRTAHVYSQIDDNGGRIEMTPCNIPGALVYYRDSRYATSYELYGDKWSDAPSYGPKHQLLVADMNYRAPYLAAAGEFATTRLPDRAGSFDAALTLQPSETFNLPGLAGITNGGNWIFLPRPAITNFNDAKGYYAGWYLTDPMDGFIYWNNIAGSCVIPAGNSYSQRITHFDGSTHPAWYGIPFRGSLLGSGNPGAANAQHGVDITLLSKSPSGDRATLRFRGGVPAAAERRLTVTVTGGTAGTIRSSDGLISAGPGTNEASASYPGGSNVTLIAEAGMGSAFVGWSAADFHGTGTQVTFEIFADTPVQAVFAEPPAAVDDRYRVAFNRAREVADAHNGVLANDVTAAPWLFAELAGGPEHGTLSLNADGSFAYSPEPGFIGADTFTYRAVDAYKLESAAPATVTLLVGPQANDYDGDGASDLAVFDPGTGRWYIRTLAGAVPAWHEPWGWPGATPVPGDYNGDGRADLAIYDTDAGLWYIRSLGGKAIAWGVRWGGPGIVPAAGDYNGDGAFDLGLYWPERGAWYAVSLAEPAWHAWDERGAWPSLARAAGDFNADGASDLCEYDTQRGKWYARSIREAGISEWITWEFSWGGPALAPVAGDFDGDGASDTAVVDLEHGLWYIVTLDMRVLAWAHPWGAAGMIPVAGDFNGDGLSDLAMYAEPGGKWYIESMADGAILAWGEPWGFPGAIPMNAVR